MMIASKNDEVYPLRIGIVYDKIGHKKISMSKLTAVEEDIVKTLDFKLT